MKRLLVFSVLLLCLNFISFAQSFENFQSELRSLKYKYKNLNHQINLVEELEDEIVDLSNEVDDLKDDIEEYIEENGLSDNIDYNKLNKEIEEFYNFTNHNLHCRCLYLFNKFISELGGFPVLLKQNQNIKVCSSIIGNFKYYYAYALYDSLYTVSVKGFSKSGSYKTTYTEGYSNFKFGFFDEIEIFEIIDAKKNMSITKLAILSRDKPFMWYVSCENEFPRY